MTFDVSVISNEREKSFPGGNEISRCARNDKGVYSAKIIAEFSGNQEFNYGSKIKMQEIEIEVNGHDVDFSLARKLARAIAEIDNPETDLISWCNNRENTVSPRCTCGEVCARPGWEVYGENHGGRLRITVNNGDYIYIFS